MTITGKYKEDSEHIFVFTENTIYTIKLFYGYPIGWGSTKVGETISKQGMVLTKERFETWKLYCDKIGTFTLPG